MKRLLRYTPHLLTLLALAFSAFVLTHYRSMRNDQVRHTELSYLARDWSLEAFDLTLQSALGERDPLPCPAYMERTLEGRYETYKLEATVTRVHAPSSPDDAPIPTCDDSPYYRITTNAGWDKNPMARGAINVLDADQARQDPNLVMPPRVRKPTQPLTITPLPDLEAPR